MDGTPRLRSAFPATPQTYRQSRRAGSSLRNRLSDQRTPDIPALQASSSKPISPETKPVIPEDIIDAPSQRLYAVCLYFGLLAWKIWDFVNLQESEEQSLWLFMKWMLLDGSFLFLLPSLRIPWLEWSPSTTVLLLFVHGVSDFMMMFNIPIPLGAGVTAVGRSIWGAYEMAVSERNVNPETVRFNHSLILGRQVIHILPEGSAILNPGKEAFCLDNNRLEARLPITINATNPISIELLRIDLDTDANETISLSKGQIKAMYRDASRMITYSDDPNEPKTLYYSTKKPGLYLLQKVIDETNLEVSRKKLAHTAVVPCPKAFVVPSAGDKCRGELSNIELLVTGTPPLRLKHRKIINRAAQFATIEGIQPEEFFSPLTKTGSNAVAVPNRIDTTWAKPQSVRVPLSESLTRGGSWIYAIEEVTDGLGNVVSYDEEEHIRQERHKNKSSRLHQVINVHERPTATLNGCNAQNPLKVAKGSAASLPIHFGSSGQSPLQNTAFHVEYLFSPPDDVLTNGEHSNLAQPKKATIKDGRQQLTIQEPGLYTLTGVSSDFCTGDILEPASCVLQNPPEPQLALTQEDMYDKCAGNPIGLRVDLNMVGTPPFHVRYRMYKKGDRHHTTGEEKINGLRGQIELTPHQAGNWVYEFTEISDAVYKNRPLASADLKLEQSVKPAATARFVDAQQKKTACIDDNVSFDVNIQGEGPFDLEYELVHGNKRTKHTIPGVSTGTLRIATGPLSEGGEYTLALATISDTLDCKEFLKDEAKISVRNQKPKVGFGLIEGARTVNTLQGKTLHLPLRLVGEGPWSIKYRDPAGNEHATKVNNNNDQLTVSQAGKYELIDVHDVTCPGLVDEPAKDFEISWIDRPELRIAAGEAIDRSGSTVTKAEVCEGDEDAIEVLFKGTPPYILRYVEHAKPQHGTIAPKPKEIRAALNVASVRMSTTKAGHYEYRLNELEDTNYNHNPKMFTPLVVKQQVNARPSVAFTNPGKTYSYCSVESDGEEVIPITLSGAPPFDVELEVKHLGTSPSETISIHATGHTHNVRIPHSKINLGKSAVQLRRISDSRGCSRLMDSNTPRVQISVHDAPTAVTLENKNDYCVGERLNFALSGAAPFVVQYEFEGKVIKASAAGTTFTRFAEKPGTFSIVGVRDSASQCTNAINITKHIHGMPWARVSKGREGYVDIHEGSQAEIHFDFGGVPPFEFTWTRSSNTERGGKKGVLLDMKTESSDDYTHNMKASEEGTYEVVAIKDRYCSYTKPGIKIDKKKQKLLQN